MTKVFVLDEGRTTEGQRDSWLVGWLVGVYSLTREFFTHIETSPLPVKGCIF